MGVRSSWEATDTMVSRRRSNSRSWVTSLAPLEHVLHRALVVVAGYGDFVRPDLEMSIDQVFYSLT